MRKHNYDAHALTDDDGRYVLRWSHRATRCTSMTRCSTTASPFARRHQKTLFGPSPFVKSMLACFSPATDWMMLI